MMKRGQKPRLPLEAGHPFGIEREQGGKNLERHFPSEPRIASAVDLPHAACADRREDLVGTDPGSGSQGHGMWNDCTLLLLDADDGPNRKPANQAQLDGEPAFVPGALTLTPAT